MPFSGEGRGGGANARNAVGIKGGTMHEEEPDPGGVAVLLFAERAVLDGRFSQRFLVKPAGGN